MVLVRKFERSPPQIPPSAASPPKPIHAPLSILKMSTSARKGTGAPKKNLKTPGPFPPEIAVGYMILGRLNWKILRVWEDPETLWHVDPNEKEL